MTMTTPEGRLNESDAHDEANMLRAKAGIYPKTGRIHGASLEGDNGFGAYLENGGRRPSSEDLDRALAEIEALRRSAKEDLPNLGDVLHDILESGSQTAHLLEMVLGLTAAEVPDITSMKGPSLVDKIKQKWQAARQISDLDTIFRDARNQLDFLKARADRFGKHEELHDIET